MDSKEAVKVQVICHVCSVGITVILGTVCMSAVLGVHFSVSADHPNSQRNGLP